MTVHVSMHGFFVVRIVKDITKKEVLHFFLGDEPLTEGQEIPSGSYEAAVSASSSWPK